MADVATSSKCLRISTFLGCGLYPQQSRQADQWTLSANGVGNSHSLDSPAPGAPDGAKSATQGDKTAQNLQHGDRESLVLAVLEFLDLTPCTAVFQITVQLPHQPYTMPMVVCRSPAGTKLWFSPESRYPYKSRFMISDSLSSSNRIRFSTPAFISSMMASESTTSWSYPKSRGLVLVPQ